MPPRKIYVTGKPCLRGHFSPRAFHNHECVACRRERDKLRYKLNKQAQQQRSRKALWKRNKYPTPTRNCPEHCELCGGPPTQRALHLDHDHSTGHFRGWLCHYCNTSLGRFGDSCEFLQRAIDYLNGQLWDETKGQYRNQTRSKQTANGVTRSSGFERINGSTKLRSPEICGT